MARMRKQLHCDRFECRRVFRATFVHSDGKEEGLCASHYESERQKKNRVAKETCTAGGCNLSPLQGTALRLCQTHHDSFYHRLDSPYYRPHDECDC